MFQLIEHALDQVPLFVQGDIILPGHVPVGFRRNDGDGSSVLHRCNDVIGIVSFIRQHGLSRMALQQRKGLLAIGSLTAGQEKAQRIAPSVAGGMDFRGKSASAPA